MAGIADREMIFMGYGEDKGRTNQPFDPSDKEKRRAPGTDRRDEPFYPRDDLVVGRNAVKEALKAGRPADSLLVQRGERTGAALPIIAACKEKGIVVKEVDQKKLDYLCGHAHHQGVVLIAAAHAYVSLNEILANAEKKGEPPFLILCDSLEDPHNLGAIIRTAECCGVHGVIIPERRSVSLSGIVSKTSAGALEYVPVARVTNLNAAIRELKKNNVWVIAADMDGVPYKEADLSGAVALVIGSEGNGVSRLVRENCDMTVSIPMKGKINSLNASVAAAVLMFETASRR